jgi:1-acyl-sn-glycerol-3-phosphate acyltransferase
VRGDSLILFPEGTRNTTDEQLLPIKSGIYHLAQKCPQIDLVPVWMENLGRLLPKGEIVPVPLLCSISFGTPLRLQPGEDKETFLGRVRESLLATMRDARPAES